MSIYGHSPKWQQAMVEAYEVVTKVIREKAWPICWRKVLKESAATGTVLEEDDITRSLIARLKLDPQIRKRWFSINSQPELLSTWSKKKTKIQGRIDIHIECWVAPKKPVLILECKRLNVKFPSGFKSLAGEYVRQGMARFVSAQYASDVSLGGMIGYVFDGDPTSAFNAIADQIASAATDLLLAPTISLQCPPDHFITHHQRPTRPIELRHLLLSPPTA